MEHQKRTTETFDKASGFHPREDTDPRNIKTLNEESPRGGMLYGEIPNRLSWMTLSIKHSSSFRLYVYTYL